MPESTTVMTRYDSEAYEAGNRVPFRVDRLRGRRRIVRNAYFCVLKVVAEGVQVIASQASFNSKLLAGYLSGLSGGLALSKKESLLVSNCRAGYGFGLAYEDARSLAFSLCRARSSSIVILPMGFGFGL
jgi:hypothetical protein